MRNPAKTLLPAAALISWISMAFASPTQARADALVGRFYHPSQGVVAVTAKASGRYQLVRRGRRGQARLNGHRLEVTWPAPQRGFTGTLRGLGTEAPRSDPEKETWLLVSAVGRLALRSPKATWQRQESSPWWRLPGATRQQLVAPFQKILVLPWKRDGFESWFQKRYAHTPVSRRLALAEWSFNDLSRGEQIALMCVHAKMSSDGIWDVVGPLKYVGTGGVLLFEPTTSRWRLRRRLAGAGFGDWWRASRGHPWGMRSRFRGVQLHFRGGKYVNVHIDFVNPGDPRGGGVSSWFGELGLALRHYEVDLRGWTRNHTPERLLREVRASGIHVTLP